MTTTSTALFERSIDSTFSQIDGVFIHPLTRRDDDRGWLIELFRMDELLPDNCPVMAYVSETKPGVARGPHEHVEQSDCFAFVGPGDFKLYLWDVRDQSRTYGIKQTVTLGETFAAAVIIPPGVIHAYRNDSPYVGWVFNAPNSLYAGEGKQGPVDEIRHEDLEDSPYVLD